MTAVTVAIAWLRAEDWPRWQSIDSKLLPFDRWLKKISTAIDQIELSGSRTEKVVVDPDVFAAWCRNNGKAIDSNSRALYAAAELLKRRS